MSNIELKNMLATQAEPKKSWRSKHRILSACLLHGVWKFEPIHVLVLLVFLAYQGWMGSPYFMYHFVGAPQPGTAPRYVGTLRVEGELQRTRSGWKPPRYFIRTNQGEKEIHCDYLPYPSECSMFYNFHKIYPDMIYEVGYDRYWGLDYIKYPDSIPSRLQPNGAAKTINFGRQLTLKYHRTPAILFVFAFLLYVLLISQSYDNRKPKKLLESDVSPPKPEPAKVPDELTELKKTQSLFDQ